MGAAALRSARWLEAGEEVGLQSRAALRAVGLNPRPGQPVIGISNTVSDLNPCNSSMANQVRVAGQAVLDAGGIPVVFPTISLGEDLMKPTAMLYRNLLSIEIEEMVRANPIDALLVTGSCDKTIPGALMGAISANIPTLMLVGGARDAVQFEGRRLASGTDLWKQLNRHRAGELSDADWEKFESCYSCGMGSCNVMGTATTMAIVSEMLGFVLTGTATIPAGDPRSDAAAAQAGTRIVQLALDPILPRDLVTAASVRNALVAVAAVGGSTNAFIHLAALAGRAGIALEIDDVREALHGIHVLADIQPIGVGLAQDFDAAGGTPTLVRALADLLDLDVRTPQATSLREVVAAAPAPGEVIRDTSNPVSESQAITLVSGSLAPLGAVIKTASASPHLLNHRGRAVVFSSYDDMRNRIDDPLLEVTADSVLVMKGCGPVGGPGMPEWGMIPIPRKLAEQGVTDMIRVSDARMSGTSFGTVILHVGPESAVGGPLALVRDGDEIVVDVARGLLDLAVDEGELLRRRSDWVPPESRFGRGWIALYQKHVSQAKDGCDFDFMKPLPGERSLVEPTVGRS